MTVTRFSVEQLGCLVARHRIDDTITKALKSVLRSDLVIVDDIGSLLPITSDAAGGVYRLTAAAYEGRSVAISSNLHPSGFDELMPPTIASALVDRLMHHPHVLVTTGDSVRLSDAADGKGGPPTHLSTGNPMAAPGEPARPSTGPTHDRLQGDPHGP